MAYTNETTHFGFPLPLGTDLTVPMDYNESLEAADTALFEAQTNAAGAVGTAGNALTIANEAKTEAASATATANSATATANAAATAANQAVADVAEAKDDALDMICAVVEETATAQYKHEPTAGGLNYYFRYNDILYKTTATINVGDTIVPNTNCEATNVSTELEAGAPVVIGEVVSDGQKTLSALLDELYAKVNGKLSGSCYLKSAETVYQYQFSNRFSYALATPTNTIVDSVTLKASGSTRYQSLDGVISDASSEVVSTVGIVIGVYR